MKSRTLVLILLLIASTVNKARAWGPEGHAVVGRLALKFVRLDVRENILAILGNMSIDTAANWMDAMK